MAKRVFVKGELLGTFGTKFVEELPQETVGKKKRRMCICECGICHNLYTTQLRMDKKDWYCTDCSVKILKEKRTKKHYVEGQILNNDTKSTLVNKKGYPLRFDFMIPFEKNKKLLAELDGEQHYHPMDYYNGEEGYQTLHSHDIAKNTYVLQHEELVLVRIPYYDYKKIDTEYVKNILTKYINIKFERGVEK